MPSGKPGPMAMASVRCVSRGACYVRLGIYQLESRLVGIGGPQERMRRDAWWDNSSWMRQRRRPIGMKVIANVGLAGWDYIG